MERVTIFIDGSNFYHALKRCFGTASIDFEKLAASLVGSRKLIRIYYYNAPVNQAEEPDKFKDQQRFFDKLRSVPYLDLKLGRLEKRRGTVVEKGVDVNIAVDMLRLAYKDTYDTAILISGDGDFAAAVEAVKDLGKHVENAFPRKGLSRHLWNACDRFVELDQDLIDQCRVTPIS